ncbi:type II toxin-antitoxin system RelE/ParE family toxin [Lactovum odontotermitis]
MAFKVKTTDIFEQDLAEIYEYIRTHFFSEQAALNTVQNILLGLKNLEVFPTGGFKVAERTGRKVPGALDYRGLVLGNYIAFYDVDEKKKQVIVDRLMSSRENWIEVLSS